MIANLTFRAYTYSSQQGFNYEALAGFVGPATENTHLLAEAGYYWADSTLRDSILWRVWIDHTWNPYTEDHLRFSQVITEPVLTIRRTYAYYIHHIISPHLVGTAYVSRMTYDPLEVNGIGSTEDRTGVQLTYDLGRHTVLRSSLTYSDIQLQNPTHDNQQALQSRVELWYRYSKNFDILLTYQYQDVMSNRALYSFRENLVILTATKYF
jgi:hypothetical protein